MLTVILAGGKGTRIMEETRSIPKALVQVGDKPMLEHVMDCFRSRGHRDFLILTGYKGEMISDYFLKREDCLSSCRQQDCLCVELATASVRILNSGEDTGSAARLRLAAPYIHEKRFFLTYCDGVCSVDLNALARFHEERGGVVTLTAVRPMSRYGTLDIGEDGQVLSMREKNRADMPLVNGGFMVMESEIFDFMAEDMQALEKDVLEPLAAAGKLRARQHDGFWQCMDTMWEKDYLCSLLERGDAPWITE